MSHLCFFLPRTPRKSAGDGSTAWKKWSAARRTLQADAALRERLISAFESLKKDYPPSPHVEKQIYDGFFERSDEELMDTFHEAEWA